MFRTASRKNVERDDTARSNSNLDVEVASSIRPMAAEGCNLVRNASVNLFVCISRWNYSLVFLRYRFMHYWPKSKLTSGS